MYLIRRPKEVDPTSIKEAVTSLARTMRMPSVVGTYEIFDRWSDFVGEYLAKQSRPLAIRDGVLVIAAANATVAKELKLGGPSLKNLINGFLKSQVVDKIEVKTGPNYARQFRHSG